MANEQTDLQRSSDQPLAATEATRPGRVFSPPVDIYETHAAITVLADMPGVAAEDLEIDLNEEGVLTISGHVAPPESEGESDVLREFRYGTFRRRFTLSESIARDGIEAKLTDGLLRLVLPKVERAKRRQIEIQTR